MSDGCLGGNLQGAPRRGADHSLGEVLLMGISVNPQKCFKYETSLLQTQMNTSSLVDSYGSCVETSG